MKYLYNNFLYMLLIFLLSLQFHWLKEYHSHREESSLTEADFIYPKNIVYKLDSITKYQKNGINAISVNLNSLFNINKKVTVILMVDMGCRNCIEGLKEIHEFYKDYKENMNLIAFAKVPNPTHLIVYQKKLGLNFPLIYDPHCKIFSEMDGLSCNDIPVGLIINRNKIYYKGWPKPGTMHANIFKEMIKKLIKSPPID